MTVPVPIKRLRGTYRDDRDAGKMELPALKSIPLPPEGWKDSQKDTWFKVCGELHSIGLLQNIGLDLLRIYCKEVWNYDQAQKILEDEGHWLVKKNGDSRRHPMADIATMAFNKIIAISGQFGFTPHAATKIKLTGKPQDEGDPDFNF